MAQRLLPEVFPGPEDGGAPTCQGRHDGNQLVLGSLLRQLTRAGKVRPGEGWGAVSRGGCRGEGVSRGGCSPHSLYSTSLRAVVLRTGGEGWGVGGAPCLCLSTWPAVLQPLRAGWRGAGGGKVQG